MQETREEIGTSQTERLTETVLTIQTVRKIMKRREYEVKLREAGRQVEEGNNTYMKTQREREEAELSKELKDRKEAENARADKEEEGDTEIENLKSKKRQEQEINMENRKREAIRDKIKRKSKWIKELIYGHGDVKSYKQRTGRRGTDGKYEYRTENMRDM